MRFIPSIWIPKPSGFSLVEVLMALTLLVILFTLANAALYGMAKISGNALGTMRKARALEFCIETMRKELGEVRFEPGSEQFSLDAGEGFLSYSTTRSEVIARSDMPRGFLRVEWKFDPDKKTLERTVTDLVQRGKEIGKSSTKRLLNGLSRVSFFLHNGKQWDLIRGKPQTLLITNAILIEIEFENGESPFPTRLYKSAFWLPR